MNGEPDPKPCRRCGANDVPKEERCRLANCPNAGTGDARCGRCSGPVVWKDALGRRHGNARSCHGCPNDGLGLPVCWAACPGPNADFQTDGQSVVTLGALEDPDVFIQDKRLFHDAIGDEGDKMAERLDGDGGGPAACATRLPPEAEEPLMRLLHVFASMKRNQLLVFHGMLNGLNLSEASAGAGFTKQNGHKVIVALLREFPELAKFVSASYGREKRHKFDVE